MFFKKRTDVEEPKCAVEEWVWTYGVKATDKDMKCRDYQYELGKQYDIPYGEEIEECKNGFHLCKELHHVTKYYPIENGNRFFVVKALVRKFDLDHYGTIFLYDFKDKLVARSIILTRELTMDEILGRYIDVDEWSDDDKKQALEIGIKTMVGIREIRKLTSLGYSEPFARLIVDKDEVDTALAVGSQPDLSMDMKCWLIFK